MRQMTNEARAKGTRSLCLARRNKGSAQIIDIKVTNCVFHSDGSPTNKTKKKKKRATYVALKVSPISDRMMLARIDELINEGKSFTLETTLSTRSYKQLFQRAHDNGYVVILLYFWLNSPELAIERVATRVSEGGHNIPQDIIRRRYMKGIKNLFHIFIPLCDFWSIHDNSSNPRRNVAFGFGEKKQIIKDETIFNQLKQYGL